MGLLRTTSLVGEMADETLDAIARYDLLEPGAKVGVAVSGGVDSWAALALLAELRDRGRLDIELQALHVELGFPDGEARVAALTGGCAAAGVALTVRRTPIGPEAIAAQTKRPCFLCARHRRQALFEMADGQAIARIVTGHHRDDALSSFIMNLLENRELSALTPRQPVFDGRLVLIRPLYAMPKDRLVKLHRQQQFPVVASGCPLDGKTRRQDALDLLTEMERRFPGAREAAFLALHRVKPDFLPHEKS
jgi:tRNA 2-thiocytidine biosynthesis protein TtcA